MRIGILTQPLGWNYGGVLQNFALQRTLVSLGHDPITFDIPMPAEPLWRRFGVIFPRRCAAKFLLRKDRPLFPLLPGREKTKLVQEFMKRYINIRYLSRPLTESDGFWRDREAFVVGSDQCWRPRYSPRIENYYLDFIPPGDDVLRIAYAASFGSDNWEYTNRQSRKCVELVSRFSAISVREESAVRLCREHLKRDADVVLDPTLLLGREAYERIIDASPVQSDVAKTFACFLDVEEVHQHLLRECEMATGEACVNFLPERWKLLKPDVALPAVERWLQGIRNADFVLTDSFHVSVFAILFNRPLCVFANSERGVARLRTLLSLVGEEDRLILPEQVKTVDLRVFMRRPHYDLEKVRTVRQKSIMWLERALSGK